MKAFFFIFLARVFYLDVNCTQPPLIIDVYYETLCPYCSQFFSNQFSTYYKYNQLKLAIINFHPYGLIKEQYRKNTNEYEFSCHHGEMECYGNKISNCFIHILGRIQSYKYLICLESSYDKFNKNLKQTAEHCLEGEENLKNLINVCMENEGNALLRKEGWKNPSSMNYVPWITVNGKYSKAKEEEIRKNLLGFVCKYNNIDCN